MDEHPALALREKKDSSILVAVDLVKDGEADAVVTAGHTGAGMAAAVLRLGRLPGVDRPALAVQMITAKGPMVLLDIGANPDSTPENLVQYAPDGRDLRRARAGRRGAARRAPVDRGGEGQGRRAHPARHRVARRDRPPFRGQRRGQGPDHPHGRRRRLRRGARQRRDQVLRGPLDLHLRPVASRVLGVAAGTPRVPADAAGHRADPERLRLREGRRVAAARRARDGHHHPRPGEATDGGIRRRGGRADGTDRRPGPHRRVARDGQAADSRAGPSAEAALPVSPLAAHATEEA